MSYIALVRFESGTLAAIDDEDGNPWEFDTEAEAERFRQNHILSSYPWQIVELEV